MRCIRPGREHRIPNLEFYDITMYSPHNLTLSSCSRIGSYVLLNILSELGALPQAPR
jgi:hypothetical protein